MTMQIDKCLTRRLSLQEKELEILVLLEKIVQQIKKDDDSTLNGIKALLFKERTNCSKDDKIHMLRQLLTSKIVLHK
jgi:hypothetical protein